MRRAVVIGCGGGGCNTVSRIDPHKLRVVTINTGSSGSESTIALASGNVPGCMGDRDLGWALASDYKDDIKRNIEGYSDIIVTAGLGGGTGAGVIPVIAECAREYNIRLISVVSVPMPFEAARRERAMTQMKEVLRLSDRTIILDIGKIPGLGVGDMQISTAISSADGIMKEAIVRCAEMLNGPFFSLFSEKAYTIAYSALLDPTKAVNSAMGTSMFDADPNYGKIIVSTGEKLSKQDEEEVVKAIGDRTGIIPDVAAVSGEEPGMLLFIPMSYRSLLS
jgi:cell division protein FtsZ